MNKTFGGNTHDDDPKDPPEETQETTAVGNANPPVETGGEEATAGEGEE